MGNHTLLECYRTFFLSLHLVHFLPFFPLLPSFPFTTPPSASSVFCSSSTVLLVCNICPYLSLPPFFPACIICFLLRAAHRYAYKLWKYCLLLSTYLATLPPCHLRSVQLNLYEPASSNRNAACSQHFYTLLLPSLRSSSIVVWWILPLA